MSAPGTVTLAIKSSGSGIVDPAGNLLTAGGSTATVTWGDASFKRPLCLAPDLCFCARADNVPPTSSLGVQIDSAAGTVTPTNSALLKFTIAFSETIVGLTASSFAVGGTTVGTAVTSVGGSGASYTVWLAGMSSSGTVTLALKALDNGVTDLAGNHITGVGGTATIDWGALCLLAGWLAAAHVTVCSLGSFVFLLCRHDPANDCCRRCVRQRHRLADQRRHPALQRHLL